MEQNDTGNHKADNDISTRARNNLRGDQKNRTQDIQEKAGKLEVHESSGRQPGALPPETLLNDPESASNMNGEPLYTIFSSKTRKWLIFLISSASFVSPLTANIYFPALNPIAEDLGVSTSLINLTLTSYMIFQAICPALFGDLGDMVGRRPVYILAFTIYMISNIGLALQRNYVALIILRCIQSAGSSGALVLGFAVTADISSTAERGKYMGIVGSGIMVAPALGPVLGGLLSQYLGWPSIFWFCAIFVAVWLIPWVIWAPETCRSIVGNGSITPQSWNRTLVDIFRKWTTSQEDPAVKRKLQFPNPLRTLTIAFQKEMALILFLNAIIYTTYTLIAATLSTLFKEIYHYNDLDVGLCYLPYGAGCCLAPFIQGHILDWNYKRIAKKIGFVIDRQRGDDLNEFPIETARIQPLYPTMLVCAASLISYGWVLQMETSVAVPLVLIFFIGLAVSTPFNVLNTLIVDLNPEAPATASAANTFVRALFGAAATAIIDFMIKGMGRGWCFTFWGLLNLSLILGLRLIDVKGLSWRVAKNGRNQS